MRYLLILVVTICTGAMIAIGAPAPAGAALEVVSVEESNDASLCPPTYTFGYPNSFMRYENGKEKALWEYPVPEMIPDEGTSFQMTITGEGTNFAPGMVASGTLVTDPGNRVDLSTFWHADAAGEPTGSQVLAPVHLKPDGADTATLSVGVNFCVNFTYHFRKIVCGTGAGRSGLGRDDNEVRIVALTGDDTVYVHKASCPEKLWVLAQKDTVLQQGDEISVGPGGEATLQFADNSTVVVTDTSQLKIASFFTEGGVVKTMILLRMGQAAAKVHKSEATKSDFRIKSPTGTASVRATRFTVFYDPGSKAMTESTKEGLVEVDPAGAGLKTVMVPAGKEVEVLPTSVSKVVRVGTAGAHGGVTRSASLRRVSAIVARNDKKCGVTTPFLNATSAKPAKAGWAVTYRVTGKLKGATTWSVVGRMTKPVNALAKKLAKGCPKAR